MRLLMNYGRVSAIVPVAISILVGRVRQRAGGPAFPCPDPKASRADRTCATQRLKRAHTCCARKTR